VALVLTLLVFAVALGLTVKRVGLEVYVALFLVAAVTSTAFMFLYFRLFF
jgi:hypothetical protein